MSVLIIAEAGVNHNGDKEMAFQLVDAAADAGADAVKFQTFCAERLAVKSAPKAKYQKLTTDTSETQLEMLRKLELPKSWHLDLQKHAEKRGIIFISTAFDIPSLDFLETLNLPLYKIPSGEITNGPLLLAFAQTGKPVVLSTGMATVGEIEQALAVLAFGYNKGKEEPSSIADIWQHWSSDSATEIISDKVTLLHCTSQYPTPVDQVNLKAMDTLARTFGLPVGYSDHTKGLLISVAAVARGAKVIEKHFTLDRSLPGPDHMASLEPDEIKTMVRDIRTIEQALGDGRKRPQVSEWDTRETARQSVIAASPIRAGEIIRKSHLSTARAGSGMSPVMLWDIIGTRAQSDYDKGDPISG